MIELHKYASPVNVHVKYLSGRMGNTYCGKYENIDAHETSIYGSFKHKEPNMENNELEIKFPKTF